MIHGSTGTPNRHIEVRVSILIDDGKRFQAMDIIYLRSNTLKFPLTWGGCGEWAPAPGTLEPRTPFSQPFSTIVLYMYVFPRHHSEAFLPWILASFGILLEDFSSFF